MNTEPQQPTKKLDHEKTNRLRLEMTHTLTELIVSQPRSSEAAAAVLSSLIWCAYTLAKTMWGPADAVRAVKAAVDCEASKDLKEKN